MFREYLESQKSAMFADLENIIRIPSVSEPSDSETLPYGKNVNDALQYAADLASGWGFESKNLGRCTEIRFGTGKGPKIYVAGHLDVVPAGDGWSTPPFEMTEKDGKLYGRGVLDDKGPSVAVMYALKALKNAGKIPDADLRLILGGEEEKGMSDLKWYVEKFGKPDFGLTPDSSFPIINAELGVIFGSFEFEHPAVSGKVRVVRLSGGRAFNCVPDKCEVVLKCEDKASFFTVMGILDREIKTLRTPTVDTSGLTVTVRCTGVSAHGSVPHKGRSAITDLTGVTGKILSGTGSGDAYIDFVNRYYSETNGKEMGIYCKDDLSGEISVNGGMANYENGRASITLDTRVPISVDVDRVCEKIENLAKANGAEFIHGKSEPGTCIPETSPFIRSVARSYEKVMKSPARFLCERGVTYAKAFGGNGAAFGPIDESDPEQGGKLHTADEYIDKEKLFSLAELYAVTLCDLCCKQE